MYKLIISAAHATIFISSLTWANSSNIYRNYEKKSALKHPYCLSDHFNTSSLGVFVIPESTYLNGNLQIIRTSQFQISSPTFLVGSNYCKYLGNTGNFVISKLNLCEINSTIPYCENEKCVNKSYYSLPNSSYRNIFTDLQVVIVLCFSYDFEFLEIKSFLPNLKKERVMDIIANVTPAGFIGLQSLSTQYSLSNINNKINEIKSYLNNVLKIRINDSRGDAYLLYDSSLPTVLLPRATTF